LKISGFILLIVLGISCATADKSGLLAEDEMFVARKYVGNFTNYCYTGPHDFGWPNTIWIETTQESVYGKIPAYSLRCEFQPGESLYIRRAYQSTGIYGYWIYQIENENNVWYKLSEFQCGNNVLAKSFR
jgi:hypothetical protein